MGFKRRGERHAISLVILIGLNKCMRDPVSSIGAVRFQFDSRDGCGKEVSYTPYMAASSLSERAPLQMRAPNSTLQSSCASRGRLVEPSDRPMQNERPLHVVRAWYALPVSAARCPFVRLA